MRWEKFSVFRVGERLPAKTRSGEGGQRKKKLKGGNAESLKQGDGEDVFIGVHGWLVDGRDGDCVA